MESKYTQVWGPCGGNHVCGITAGSKVAFFYRIREIFKKKKAEACVSVAH